MVRMVFSVRDVKAGAFSLPFYQVNEGVAIRSFIAACKDMQGEIAKFPEDYELFKLGTWDDESGKFDCGIPVFLGRGDLYLSNQLSLFDRKEAVS